MKLKVFEKILMKNLDISVLKDQSINDIIKRKNSLRADLTKFFRLAYIRWYNATNREKVREKNKIASKKKYHEDVEYRLKKIERTKELYLEKTGGTKRPYEFATLILM